MINIHFRHKAWTGLNPVRPFQTVQITVFVKFALTKIVYLK